LRELAMAIKWGTQAKIDLLTIDGAPGGTGMSPWRMMSEWGITSIYLHSKAIEFANYLMQKGETHICDFAFAGGLSTEDHLFKAIALGSPHVKAVCMGRALMIPGFVGKNFEEWYKKGKLPKTVSQYGSKPEEIFVCYERIKELVGKDEMKNIPMGAIGLYSFVDKLRVGLQQLMAGARCFRVHAITRNELMSLTKECAEVTGVPYITDAYQEEAMEVLDSVASYSII
jgi:glutamate synthase domain-containing protein 2